MIIKAFQKRAKSFARIVRDAAVLRRKHKLAQAHVGPQAVVIAPQTTGQNIGQTTAQTIARTIELRTCSLEAETLNRMSMN